MPFVRSTRLDMRSPTLIALAVLITGCSSEAPVRATPATQSPVTPHAPIIATNASSEPVSTVEPIALGSAISVDRLVQFARSVTPNQQVYLAHRRVAIAALSQAGVWENPEVEISGGRSVYRKGEAAGEGVDIYGASVRQKIAWPGKRAARQAAAQAAAHEVEAEQGQFLLDLDSDVRAAALELVLSERAALQAEQAVAIGAQVVAAVSKQQAAGEVDRGEEVRARLDQAQVELLRDGRQSDIAANRAALTALCSGRLPATFTITDAIAGEAAAVPAITQEQALAEALAHHPRLRVLSAQRETARAELAKEHREGYPDLTLGAFRNHEADTDSTGVTLGLSIPLWDRNQGNIAGAEATIARIDAELRVEQAAIEQEIRAAWADYEKQHTRWRRLSSEIRPLANESLNIRLKRYQAGEHDLLELLDARRSLQTADDATLEALGLAEHARLRLAKAIGTYPPVPVAPGAQP